MQGLLSRQFEHMVLPPQFTEIDNVIEVSILLVLLFCCVKLSMHILEITLVHIELLS